MKKLLGLALLGLPACVFQLGGSGGWDWSGPQVHNHTNTTINGRQVNVDDGVITVDGVRLNHSRWVQASFDGAPGAPLHVATASGGIELHAAPGAGSLSVLLHSQVPEDGRVVVKDGELVAEGERGVVFLDEVHGSLPAGVALRVSTSTGEIQLHGFAGAPGLDVDSGIGDILLDACSAGTVHVQAGTGDVAVRGGAGQQLSVDCGTGDIACNGATFDDARLSSGTGDLVVEGCGFKRLQADSGTGDAVIRGGAIVEVHHNLGTGDLDWH